MKELNQNHLSDEQFVVADRKRIRIAICDDMDSDRKVLHEGILHFFQKRGEIVEITEYNCGETLIDDMKEGYEKFEIIFMDIFMEEMTGIEAAGKIREFGIKSPIVFLTVTSEFAIESYDVQASGYLLKPLDQEKLDIVLERLLEPVERARIAFRCEGKMRYFFMDEIVWIESNKHKIIFHFNDGKSVQTHAKLGDVEENLHDERFLRCHQSYLINMDYIADVTDVFVTKQGNSIPIRVRSRKAITDAYHSYFVKNTVEKLPKEDIYV